MSKISKKLKQIFALFRPMSAEELKAQSPSYIGGAPEAIPKVVTIPGSASVLHQPAQVARQ